MVASLKNVQPPARAASKPVAVKPWPFSSQRLAEQLAADGFLPPATVMAVIADSTASGRPIVDIVLERELMTDVALRDAMSKIFGLEVADPSSVEPDDDVADFPTELARTHLVYPLGIENDRLVVAIADPTRASVLREIHRAVGKTLDLRIAARGDLAHAVEDAFAPRIVVKLPNGGKSRFLLPPGDLKIGRASHNEIIIPDPGVSATHAIIRSRGGAFELVDFGSRNGVFVNGERIREPYLLAHKDEIQVGQTIVKFKLPARSDEVREMTAAKAEKQSARMHRAWINFAGRIIAQMLGAAALIFLGLAIGGGLPSSCGTPNVQSAEPSAVSTAD